MQSLQPLYLRRRNTDHLFKPLIRKLDITPEKDHNAEAVMFSQLLSSDDVINL